LKQIKALSFPSGWRVQPTSPCYSDNLRTFTPVIAESESAQLIVPWLGFAEISCPPLPHNGILEEWIERW